MTDEPTRLDAPNQQVVRPDASGPADEGDGGSSPAATPKRAAGKPGPKPKDPPADTERAEKG